MVTGSGLTWSEDVGKLALAISKAQAAMAPLVAAHTAKIPTKSGPGYSYSYANLPDALACCLPVYNENECCVVQSATTDPNGNGVEVHTAIFHSSGQWVKADPLFIPVKGGAQDVGSAITYGRRYQLLGIVGLAPTDDDDGARAQANAPESWGNNNPTTQEPLCVGKLAPVADACSSRCEAFALLVGADKYDVWAEVCRKCNVEPFEDGSWPAPHQLTKSEGLRVKDALKRWVEARTPQQDPAGAP